MESEQARQRTHISAERMRIVSESARENAHVQDETNIENLQSKIDVTAMLEREAIDELIGEAANMGQKWTRYIYTERISAMLQTRQVVTFIETVSNLVTAKVVESLQTDGFEVSTTSSEVLDFRQSINEQPEYYETYFAVKW